MITMSLEDLCVLLTRASATRPEMHIDTERLAAVLGSYTDTSFDALLDEVRELKAQLELRTRECIEAKAKGERQLKMAAQMDAGARNNVADALGRPDVAGHGWGSIETTVREFVAERASMLERIYRAETGDNGRVPPDAVPVLRVGDVNADGVEVRYRAPLPRFYAANVVDVCGHRYLVTKTEICRFVCGPDQLEHALRLQALYDAPTVPTGEGLTIARVPACGQEEWARTGIATESSDAQIARIARAIEGDVDPSVSVADGAIGLIEGLQDERARHEQRRLDLAEKLGLGSLGTWEQIAAEVEQECAGWKRSDAEKAGERLLRWCPNMSQSVLNGPDWPKVSP